jgi:hypothetical protein
LISDGDIIKGVTIAKKRVDGGFTLDYEPGSDPSKVAAACCEYAIIIVLRQDRIIVALLRRKMLPKRQLRISSRRAASK